MQSWRRQLKIPRLPCILLAGLVACFPQHSLAERQLDGAQFDRELLWLDESDESLLFIPQSVFDHKSLEDLPLGNNSTLQFRLAVHRQPEVYRSQFASGVVPDCWVSGSKPTQGADPHPLDLATLLTKTSDVYSGTVQRVIPGWDRRNGRVAQLVVVRVEDRFRAAGPNPPAEVGEQIFFIAGGGRITVEETELCDLATPGFHQPQAGDEVLLAGRLYPTNRLFFEGYVFPVENELVLPQPIPALRREQTPVPLEAVASGLQAVEPGVMGGP